MPLTTKLRAFIAVLCLPLLIAALPASDGITPRLHARHSIAKRARIPVKDCHPPKTPPAAGKPIHGCILVAFSLTRLYNAGATGLSNQDDNMSIQLIHSNADAQFRIITGFRKFEHGWTGAEYTIVPLVEDPNAIELPLPSGGNMDLLLPADEYNYWFDEIPNVGSHNPGLPDLEFHVEVFYTIYRKK